jgi:hypothetical protein
MVTLFSDPAAWREANTWKALYATPSMDTASTQLFANFGSCSEETQATVDVSALVSRIAEQFAMDVYGELKNDIGQAALRSSRTSQGSRDPPRPVMQRTPVVTPHNNSRRLNRMGH